MHKSLTLAIKDLRLLVRDKSALFWVLAFPVMIAVLFGYVFGGSNGPSKIDIAIIDQDQSSVSENLVKQLRASSALEIDKPDQAGGQDALAAASDAVRKGNLAAYVLIPRGLGAEFESHSFTKGPGLKIGIDPKKGPEAGMLQGVLGQAVGELMKNQAVSSGFVSASSVQGPDITDAPVTASGGPASPFEITFPQALIWGLLGVISSFVVSVVKEREQGTLTRLMTSMSMMEVLMGKALACLFASLGMMTALLLLGHFAFGVRLGSPLLLAMALLSGSICIVGIMMLLSVLGRTEQSVSGSSWGIMITMSMFGGGMIPVFMMPGWMQSASNASPLKWTVLSIEGAIWRGFSVREMLTPCLILLAIGAVCFGTGVKVFQAKA